MRFDIREGVYQLTEYPVRVSHLGFTEDGVLRSALERVVKGLLQQHMRRGAVPPHAMVLNWTRALKICEGGDLDMIEACQVIAQSGFGEVGSAVSNHF